MSYETAYQENHVDFEISNIQYEDDFQQGSLSEEQSEIKNLQSQIEALEKREEENDVDLTATKAQIRSEIEEVGGTTSGTSIQFEYDAPAISVDSAGRFTSHEIIGGSTVRQKIGEEPLEITVDGVCKEPIAVQLDTLRDAKSGVLLSNRFSGGSVEVQFASVSTPPLEDSGAVAMKDNEFLYNYTISAIEVSV